MKPARKGKVFVGTSGYNYPHWMNGVFYPKGLSSKNLLEYYSQHFCTVELNVTFYRLPSPDAFTTWRERTPSDFIFSVKGSRFITHVKKLKGTSDSLKAFLDRATLLGNKLGPILWQLPPSMKPDYERLKNFIEQLSPFGLKFVFEFRNRSAFRDDIIEIMKKHGMSICISDYPDLPEITDADFSFIYIRKHGVSGRALYASCYTLKELETEAERIKGWLSRGIDTYIYFNNDAMGYAVKNAQTLKKLLEKY
ncbi:MAG: DUF72 domain-containing protein [Candidatus Aenigmatarchaeota archaeon]